MFLRNTIIILWIAALGVGGYFMFQQKKPCEEPLAYTIGHVDARHNINEQELRALVKKAEAVWEIPTGKDLFMYQESADLKINLVFDEKQTELLKLRGREESLNKEAARLESERLKLEQLQQSYENKLRDYNEQVAKWNNGPRTNKSEFDRLKQTEGELNTLGNKLDIQINTYNKLVQNYNTNVDTFNQTATFEEQAGVTLGSKEIDIFILDNDEDDVYLVAHELGHAIGISGHTEDTSSLMYYKLPENLTSISQHDLELLNNVCSSN